MITTTILPATIHYLSSQTQFIVIVTSMKYENTIRKLLFITFLGIFNFIISYHVNLNCFEQNTSTTTTSSSSTISTSRTTHILPYLLYAHKRKIKDDDNVFEKDFTQGLGIPAEGKIEDLKESEEIYFKGTIMFQKFIQEKQLKQCERNEPVKVISLPRSHRYGLFSQVLGVAHSLLAALANDHVLSWHNFQTLYADLKRCPKQTLDCFFQPITTCDGKPKANFTENRRNSCVFEYPRSRMHEKPFLVNREDWQDVLPILGELSGVQYLQRDDLFNAQFYISEAIRFVMRPNEEMIQLTRDLLKTDLAPFSDWKPFSHLIKRIGVHIRAGKDKKGHTGILGVDYYLNHVNKIPGNHVNQVLFSTDSPEASEEFTAKLNKNVPSDEKICKRTIKPKRDLKFIAHSRFGNAITSLKGQQENGGGTSDPGMLLIAQCYIFATVDMFVGLYVSNIGQVIVSLMGSLRHSTILNSVDANGSPMSICHQFSEYPLRQIRHPHMIIS